LASLAYDKPGSGASRGDWTRQTLTGRAEESAAAVQALRGRDDVLAGAVALLGGSQGGWVAQLTSSLADTVAAVVTAGGPGVGVLAQEEYRLRHQLPAEGFY
jgi:pimeloyl-ACP methyl ester carboxylesterase